MTDLIELATGKLNDPILMDWALDRYRQAKGRSHSQEPMEQAWFDELTLRRWLNSDDQVARGLFGHRVYRQLASDIRKGETQQSFQELEAFFREDAPLGQIDQPSRENANLDDLIELVESIEQERRTYGSVWVAKAMGQLGWSTFIDPLTAAMCEDCGDFLCEAANEALTRIGEPAQDHVIQHWESLDSSQRIYGLSVIEAVGGEPAASFAFDRYDELFQDDPEHWCQLALSVPELRLLQLLEQHLPRQQRLFDETFYQLARLLEVAHPDLESIAERVQKAQADMQAHRAAMIPVPAAAVRSTKSAALQNTDSDCSR
jgi:hypothetical protein